MVQAQGSLLRRPGFVALLATEGLGAVSDNLYKIVVALLATRLIVDSGAGTYYLALSGAMVVLPYLLFSGYAGYVSDAFSKRSVLIATKAFEILAAGLALAAFLSGNIEAMLAVLFFTATQSTFFSPAKYGILPEVFSDQELSRANGLLEMVNFFAIILGTVAGSLLFDIWAERIAWIGFALIGVAVLGSLTSFGIARVPGPAARPRFRLSPWHEVGSGIARLRADRRLSLTVLAISYFWFLGAFVQLALILFAKDTLLLDDTRAGLLQAAIAVGIGLGCVAAGWLSGRKVELGLVPLGSAGMAVTTILLAVAVESFAGAAATLVVLGFTAGLFIVPLNAFLQQRSPPAERGRIIAVNNFFNMLGVLVASAALWVLPDIVGLSSAGVILVLGVLNLVATIVALRTVPEFLIRLCLWLLAHTVYRIRSVGVENVPPRGPALLVCNHVSYVDALLVAACVQRFIRFIANRDYYEKPLLGWLMRRASTIPVSAGRPKDAIRAMRRAREELQAGHTVCVFAEGAMSRSGNPLPFQRGFEKIVAGLDVPIIPVHLDRVWGSIFSFHGGRFIWKRPRLGRYPVTVSFGRPMPSTATAFAVRQAVQELGSEAWALRRRRRETLAVRFAGMARRRWFAPCMVDSTGLRLGFGRALVAGLVFARWFRRNRPDQPMVGVLLPASVAGALANIGLTLAGRVPVNLNFTAGPAAMESAIAQCGIKTIVTSRTFLEKARVAQRDGMVFVEDLKGSAGPLARALLAAAALLLPSRWLAALYGGRAALAVDPAAILFSSGSTGEPKGVVLSHHNILSNIEAVSEVLAFRRDDRLLGALPFFHAFGLTATLWAPLVCGLTAVFHPSPTDAKGLGALARRERPTLLVSTPTFCNAYARLCAMDDFSSLRLGFVGAERLTEAVASAFRDRFGIGLLEGYGATEMGPVVAGNVPDIAHWAVRQTGVKPGTVGHPLPGVAARVVDLETGAALPEDREGMLLLKSPARMLGYLGDPARTEAVLRDGWYVSGDVAAIDADGFIRITDRLSRFSKIAGEMIPHGAVESAIAGVPGVAACSVTAVPDPQRGERLVAFYTDGDGITPAALAEALGGTGLPRLWLPKAENIRRLAELPMLATGKVDLRRLRQLAAEGAA